MIAKLITLISLCTHAGRAFHVFQPYRAEVADGEARLRCSYHVKNTPEEMRVALYRGMYGEEQVCASTFNYTQSYFQTEGPVRCRGELSAGRVDLIISGLRGEDTDLYRCRLEVLYPPPYLIKFGNGTLFHIPVKTECPTPAAQAQDDSDSTIIILPVAALAFFILILFIIILTYKIVTMSYRRRMYASMPPVISKRVDCRFGYENFL